MSLSPEEKAVIDAAIADRKAATASPSANPNAQVEVMIATRNALNRAIDALIAARAQSTPSDTKLTLRYVGNGLWQDEAMKRRGCVVVERNGDVSFKYRNERGKLELIRRRGSEVVMIREG